MNTKTMKKRGEVTISKRTVLHLGTEGEWPYVIRDTENLDQSVLTTAEFNAIARQSEEFKLLASYIRGDEGIVYEQIRHLVEPTNN